MFSSIGPLEIILVIVVLLVIFGPKRLPSLGKSLGTGMREFKDSITGDDKQREEETDATVLVPVGRSGTVVRQAPSYADYEAAYADDARFLALSYPGLVYEWVLAAVEKLGADRGLDSPADVVLDLLTAATGETPPVVLQEPATGTPPLSVETTPAVLPTEAQVAASTEFA